MALIRALSGSSGGGSTNMVEGYFQSSTTANTVVNDVGFKPDYLVICPNDGLTKAYYYEHFYDSDTPTKEMGIEKRTSDKSMTGNTMLDIPNTNYTYGGLISVDANGFTFSKVTGSGSNYPPAPHYYYCAVKKS